MTEDRLQQECFRWWNNTYPMYRGLLFHVPNGGSRNAREGAKFKTMGVVKGVSDFIFLWSGDAFFIELKVKGGCQSQDQKHWEALVKGERFDYFVVWNFTDFKDLITKIIDRGFD